MRPGDLVKIVSMVVLGVNILAAIIGLTIAAVLTDRNLANPERFVLFMALVVALIGGLSVVFDRPRVRLRRPSDEPDEPG